MWKAGPDDENDICAASREFSGAQILFHTVVGEVMGISPTDYKCLDLLLQARSPLTAGRLANLSGLTTGAITGVIDRLERLALVHRLRDPGDRRRVRVAPVAGAEAKIGWIFEPLSRAVTRLMDEEFDAAEQEAVHRYLRLCTDVLREHTHRLRSLAAPTESQAPGTA